MPILGQINAVLQSCVFPSHSRDHHHSFHCRHCHRKPDPSQRFGALNMTAALGAFIMHHPEVKNNMEVFLSQHVLPEFTSPEPYMRAIVSPVVALTFDTEFE